MNNRFSDFRLKLIFLALCILLLLSIKRHISLGYAPEIGKKSIAVAFDYHGAFEKEVEILVSQLEEAYMELDGIKNIYSVSEPGKGYILCTFSDKTRLDETYVQISDISAAVWSDFPQGVNRPTITRSSKDSHPVYIACFPLEMDSEADQIKEAYEAVGGVGEVELGGRTKKELIVELHSGRLSGMALPSHQMGSLLRRSNLARKVAMPGGQTLVMDSQFAAPQDFGQVMVTPGLRLSDVADLEYKEAEYQGVGRIDGRSMLLFLIKKSGEGNTVKLCRQLEKVTSSFGGSQLYNFGDKIEKSFILTLFSLFLLLAFLFLDQGLKTKDIRNGVGVACCYIFSLLAAIATVSAAGFQVDMTVMAALFFVIILSALSGCIQSHQYTPPQDIAGREYQVGRIKLAISFFIMLFALIVALYMPIRLRNMLLPFSIALVSGFCTYLLCSRFIKPAPFPALRISVWCFSPFLLLASVFLHFSSASPFSSDVSFSLEYESGTSFSFIEKSALEIESALLDWKAFDRLTLHLHQGRASFNVLGGKKGNIVSKILEISAQYPEIFFYIPEKHTRRAIDVTVYGTDVSEIENNILQLAKYVNNFANNVNIVYNFKSDITNIVLEIPVKYAMSGFCPYDVYKCLYYTISEPVVDKYFVDKVETDVKIRGEAKYRESLAGLLSAPLVSPLGGVGTAGDYITVRKEQGQERIYHKNRMRSMSFSVTGIGKAQLLNIVSSFPFTGSCHGEVGQ